MEQSKLATILREVADLIEKHTTSAQDDEDITPETDDDTKADETEKVEKIEPVTEIETKKDEQTAEPKPEKVETYKETEKKSDFDERLAKAMQILKGGIK